MMKRKYVLLVGLMLAVCMLAAAPLCSYAVQVKSNDGQIAASVEAENEGMAVPVYADQIVDGTYDITVESSSSMFKVIACSLTVVDGKMSADMTLSGTGYEKLYMGTDSEAAAAAESDCIPYTENTDGSYAYTVPVEALNKEINCAAFSSRSQKWFPRTLIFQSASLPEGAVAEMTDAPEENAGGEVQETAVKDTEGILLPEVDDVDSTDKNYKKASEAKASEIQYAPVNLADGKYTIPVSMDGGSGRATVESPAEMKVENRRATAVLRWSSPNYDYMVVDGLLYEPVNTEGNSVFEIPVTKFDGDMKVIADTTAMSQPYEIEYTLDFDLKKAESLGMTVRTKGILLVFIIIAVIAAGFIRGRLRSGKRQYDEMAEEEENARMASSKQVSKKKQKRR